MTQRLETLDKQSEKLDVSFNLHREVQEERRRSTGCHDKNQGKPKGNCRDSEEDINIELTVNIYDCDKQGSGKDRPAKGDAEKCESNPRQSEDHKRDAVAELPKECGKEKGESAGKERSCWQRMDEFFTSLEQGLMEFYRNQRRNSDTYVIVLPQPGDNRSQIARPIDQLLGCTPFPKPGIPGDFIPLPRPVFDRGVVPPPAPAYRADYVPAPAPRVDYVPPPAPAQRADHVPPPAPAQRGDHVPPPAPSYRAEFVPPPAPAREWAPKANHA